MNWKTLKEYIPLLSLLSIFLIALGLIRQVIYYTYFGIEIQFYVTVPELILVLSNSVILIFGVIITTFFVTKKIEKNFESLAEKHLKEIEQKSKGEQSKVFKVLFRRLHIYLTIIVVMGVTLIILAIVAHVNYKLIVFVVAAYFTLLLPLIRFERKIRENNAVGVLNKNFFQLAYNIAFFLFLLICLTALDCIGTEKGQYVGTKIYTKDSTYVSDKNHFYIGKTQNYYFIYNKDNSTLVIPEREVTKFELKAK